MYLLRTWSILYIICFPFVRESSKPRYVTKAVIRNSIGKCDVNSIGSIHDYLEQIGAINYINQGRTPTMHPFQPLPFPFHLPHISIFSMNLSLSGHNLFSITYFNLKCYMTLNKWCKCSHKLCTHMHVHICMYTYALYTMYTYANVHTSAKCIADIFCTLKRTIFKYLYQKYTP